MLYLGKMRRKERIFTVRYHQLCWTLRVTAPLNYEQFHLHILDESRRGISFMRDGFWASKPSVTRTCLGQTRVDVLQFDISFSRCSRDRWLHGNCWDELHPSVLPVQTFPARSFHATSKVSNHYFNWLPIPNVGRTFPSEISPDQEPQLCREDILANSHLNVLILTSSTQVSIIIHINLLLQNRYCYDEFIFWPNIISLVLSVEQNSK